MNCKTRRCNQCGEKKALSVQFFQANREFFRHICRVCSGVAWHRTGGPCMTCAGLPWRRPLSGCLACGEAYDAEPAVELELYLREHHDARGLI